MIRLTYRMACTAASLAAFSLVTTPVLAADIAAARSNEITRAAPQLEAWAPGQEVAERHRRHRDGGIDGGDILAGVLILGGIAAIASAASKPKREKQEPEYREPYPDERPEYQESERYDRPATGSAMSSAIDTCVAEIERGPERVGAVDAASRTDDGWRVAGQLSGGTAFSCSVDNQGRIRAVDLGDGYTAYRDEPGEGQWADDEYASARLQAEPAY